jgi:hypothetical protein
MKEIGPDNADGVGADGPNVSKRKILVLSKQFKKPPCVEGEMGLVSLGTVERTRPGDVLS